MNETRTYGVEIETHSKVSRVQLASVIDIAIRQFGHRCISQSYHHNTDGTNFTCWEVKPDSSLNPSPFAGYSVDAEIVSPVLKGHEGFQVLKAVCDAIRPYVKISKKCGLHVHHKVSESELKPIASAWLRAEKWFMGALPNSRQNNYFCRTWARAGATENFSNYSTFRRWYEGSINDRYTSLNYISWWLRGTIEFRCGSGTYKYAKIKNWVLATQALIEMASKAPANHFDADSIYQFEEKLVEYSNNGANPTTATRRYVPRSEAMAFVHDRIDEGIYKRSAIIRAAVTAGFNRNTIGTYLSDWQELTTDRHNPFRAEKKVVRNTFGYLVWEHKTTQSSTPSVSYRADEDHIIAIDWLVNRNEYFATQRP